MPQINKPNVIMKPSDLYKQATGQALDAYKTMESVMNMKKRTELQSKQFEWNKRLKAAESLYNAFIVPGANAHPGKFPGFVREMGSQLAPFLELVGFSPQSAQTFLSKLSQVTPGQEEIMGYTMSNFLVNAQQAESKGLTPQQADAQARKIIIDFDPLAGQVRKRETGDQGLPEEGIPATQGAGAQTVPGYSMQIPDQAYPAGVNVPRESAAGGGMVREITAYAVGQPVTIESGGIYTLKEGEDFNTAKGSLAYYLAGGTPNQAPPQDLAVAWRRKIDALNPEAGDTIKLPEWVDPEVAAKPLIVENKKGLTPGRMAGTESRIRSAVGNIQRAIPIAGTAVGRTSLKKSFETGMDEFKVYWSNKVLTPEMIRNAAAKFSPTDLRDYVLGISGQTQKLQAETDLRTALQEDAQKFRREMFDEEMEAQKEQFLTKLEVEQEDRDLARERFEHLESLDWTKMSIDERQMALAESMATESYILMVARAKLKALTAVEGTDPGLKEFLGYADQILDPYLKDPEVDVPDELKGLMDRYLDTLGAAYGLQTYKWHYYRPNGALRGKKTAAQPTELAPPGSEKEAATGFLGRGTKKFAPVAPISVPELRGVTPPIEPGTQSRAEQFYESF